MNLHYIYKICKNENLIQPQGEPREQHFVIFKLFRIEKDLISNFWFLISKISLLETLKLPEVLVFIEMVACLTHHRILRRWVKIKRAAILYCIVLYI